MWFTAPLSRGVLLRRINRFLVEVRIDGRAVGAHLANSGRLAELMTPGTEILLSAHSGPHRRTAHSLELVRFQGRWVSVNAQWPGAVVAEAIGRGRIGSLQGYRVAGREVPVGDRRFDLVAVRRGVRCMIETKSVTLVENETGLFPDAPTIRGRKHVELLHHLVTAGMKAAVVFCIQRGDALGMAPNPDKDPAFWAALRAAASAGVLVLAHRCRVSSRGIVLGSEVPVTLLEGGLQNRPLNRPVATCGAKGTPR